jgi:anti-sigma28 factor (negative regulator of flagellin synthesis)
MPAKRVSPTSDQEGEKGGEREKKTKQRITRCQRTVTAGRVVLRRIGASSKRKLTDRVDLRVFRRSRKNVHQKAEKDFISHLAALFAKKKRTKNTHENGNSEDTIEQLKVAIKDGPGLLDAVKLNALVHQNLPPDPGVDLGLPGGGGGNGVRVRVRLCQCAGLAVGLGLCEQLAKQLELPVLASVGTDASKRTGRDLNGFPKKKKKIKGGLASRVSTQ